MNIYDTNNDCRMGRSHKNCTKEKKNIYSKIKETCETIYFFQMKRHYNDFGAAIINLKD